MSDAGVSLLGMARRNRLLGMRRDAAELADKVEAAALNAAYLPAQVGLQPPVPAFYPEDNHLSAIVWSDLMGQSLDAVLTRASAIAIPALARQRHLLCGTVARCPLVAMRRDQVLPDEAQPGWMYGTSGELPPYHRMLWTVDDLVFYGWSLWRARRGYDNGLLSADRVPWDRWETDVAGRILVDGEPMGEGEVIAIPGPHEGILSFGAPALRRTIANLDAAANAARNPSAYLELHYTGDAELTDSQIDAHIQRWADARRGKNGGVSWTNKVLELREHGTHESHLLIEGRNADAVDVSRLVSSPASMADATNAGASLTYETSEGRNGEFIDYGVGLYMDAIAARLSMDDVVPRGQRAAFDTTQMRQLAPAPTGAPTQD